MRITTIALCFIAFTGSAVAAETPKTAQVVKATQAAKSSPAPKAPRVPSREQLTCRTGPNDEQVRLVVLAVKGRPMEFAYYSRLGTKVCSIHTRRGDAYAKWEDKQADIAHVSLLEGSAELEYKPGYAKLRFSDVARMPYCGMLGELNGVVEVINKKSECTLNGVFE